MMRNFKRKLEKTRNVLSINKLLLAFALKFRKTRENPQAYQIQLIPTQILFKGWTEILNRRNVNDKVFVKKLRAIQ